MNLDPSSIIVKNRQRKSVDIDEHFISSVKRRLIQPIVVRKENDEIHLVVGGRRLAALTALETNPLIENVHFRFIENLSPTEARVAELEENINRSELPWRDHILGIAEIHETKRAEEPTWDLSKTAEAISTSERWIRICLMVRKNLDSPILKDAGSISQAYNLLQLAAERKTGQILGDIINAGKQIFSETGTEPVPEPTPIPASSPEAEQIGEILLTPGLVPDSETNPIPSPKNHEHVPVSPIQPAPEAPKEPQNPVIQADFLDWISSYSGPKFNLIHVDFPYNVEYKAYAESISSTEEDYESKNYWELLDGFIHNLDRFASYSAHIMFWFSMEFYEATRTKLDSVGLFVHRHPLIWFKSDNAGIIPGRDNQYPRRVYETALLCSRGRRPLVRSLANCYPSPLPNNAIHPSQKSEPMLKHFFGMLIDETTDVFDPTCGSGAALRAAEELGCRKILGLDTNKDYVERANSSINQARILRRIKL
jgi:hypothetical protein